MTKPTYEELLSHIERLKLVVNGLIEHNFSVQKAYDIANEAPPEPPKLRMVNEDGDCWFTKRFTRG